jgi:hypothetical protein
VGNMLQRYAGHEQCSGAFMLYMLPRLLGSCNRWMLRQWAMLLWVVKSEEYRVYSFLEIGWLRSGQGCSSLSDIVSNSSCVAHPQSVFMAWLETESLLGYAGYEQVIEELHGRMCELDQPSLGYSRAEEVHAAGSWALDASANVDYHRMRCCGASRRISLFSVRWRRCCPCPCPRQPRGTKHIVEIDGPRHTLCP